MGFKDSEWSTTNGTAEVFEIRRVGGSLRHLARIFPFFSPLSGPELSHSSDQKVEDRTTPSICRSMNRVRILGLATAYLCSKPGNPTYARISGPAQIPKHANMQSNGSLFYEISFW